MNKEEFKFRQDFLYRTYDYYNGILYRWGGNLPSTGLDCSGFVQDALDFPALKDWQGDYNCQMMLDHYDKRNMLHLPDTKWYQPGNIIFFGKKPRSARHVAFYFGFDPDSGKHLILDAGRGGSAVTTVLEAWQRDAKVGVRSITEPLEVHDIVGVVDLWEVKQNGRP